MRGMKVRVTDEEALALHAQGRPGKLQIAPTKPLTTQRDLSLAYSPGVAAPCLKIHKDPDAVYDYTTRGNMVAIISNGTAVLGLGNLGALASKPVMEGKAVLFKRFADVDGIDLEVDTQDVEEFINCVRLLGPSFGGINLEDIKAPECFIIEKRLREMMDIPVFHDDQHGTAIIAAAGIINALDITGRNIKKTRLVVNGAGAAAIACTSLIKTLGLLAENIIMCDTKGVIYKGRTEAMNPWKAAFAADTKARTLEEAIKGADVFLGLSVKGAVTKDMVASMAKKPIIFAMANPNPEITPEEVYEIRQDAIMATGRSDYPNQINNVLGFPYIFRGALDVRASAINDEMKLAAARALAELAREDVPDEVSVACGGRQVHYGPEYIIPVPFDPRLITRIPPAVAEAAMKAGVARKPIADFEAYRQALRGRLDPTADSLEMIFRRARINPRRVVFAEGEEERVIRAAMQFKAGGYGTPVLVGSKAVIREHMKSMGVHDCKDIEIRDADSEAENKKYGDYLYMYLHRRGFLQRDCEKLVRQNGNVLAAAMVAMDEADALVTGLTRGFVANYKDLRLVIESNAPSGVFGLSIAIAQNRTVFLADTVVNVSPSPARLAEISIQAADWAQRLGHQPRVALLSFASFGQPQGHYAEPIRAAVKILNDKKVPFEFDGEMAADIALNYPLMKRLYPFCRLTGPANILVMPNLQTAHVSAKLLENIGNANVIGPILHGFDRPVQIVRMNATVSDIVTAAVMAASQTVKG
jgi:malate dehydrogenase (oxaloacetate-decarboxylating)(NADP+)